MVWTFSDIIQAMICHPGEISRVMQGLSSLSLNNSCQKGLFVNMAMQPAAADAALLVVAAVDVVIFFLNLPTYTGPPGRASTSS
jgi:hypothetical protein